MTRILDRLLARQRKLLEDLDERPATNPRPKPCVAADPEGERVALDLSEQLLTRGELAEAEATLSPFRDRAVHVRTLTNLAKIYTQTHRVDQAIDLLHRAESIAGFDEKVWNILARLYASKGNTRQEIVYRRRLAFASTRPNAQAYVDLLRLLIRTSSPAKGVLSNEVRRIVAAFDSIQDPAPEETISFARAIYPLTTMRERAVALYRSVDPCPDAKLETRANWWTLSAWCEAREQKLRRLESGGVAGHRPSVAEIHDVVVHPAFHWIPILDQGRAVVLGMHFGARVTCSTDPAAPLLLDASDAVELRLPRELRQVREPAVLIGSSDNYYIHLLEQLGTLAIADALGVDKTLPVVVGRCDAAAQAALFDVLGIHQSQRLTLENDAPVRFEHLFVVTRPIVPGERVDSLLAPWCRSRLDPNLRDTSRQNGKAIFLRLDGDGGRAIDNDAELQAALEGRNVEILSPAALGLVALLEAIRRAATVIGVTSAPLVNTVFAEPGLRIIELRPVGSGPRISMHFDQLAMSCGHLHTAVDCPAVQSDRPMSEADVLVDIKRLLEVLD